MREKVYGVRVFTGADGAGLPGIESELPEIRNPLDLPLRRGNREELQAAMDNTTEVLLRCGYTVGSARISEARWPDHRVAMRPSYIAVVQTKRA